MGLEVKPKTMEIDGVEYIVSDDRINKLKGLAESGNIEALEAIKAEQKFRDTTIRIDKPSDINPFGAIMNAIAVLFGLFTPKKDRELPQHEVHYNKRGKPNKRYK